MVLLHLRAVLLLGVVSYGVQDEAPVANTKAELLEGPWETTTDSGIDGIFLSILGDSTNIRVYHRSGGKENWGYFAASDKATAQSEIVKDDHSFTLFDGTHLRIHFVDVTDLRPFDLDITFSPASHQWSGTWSRSRQTLNVALRRPKPNSGVTPNVFVGDWVGEPSKPFLAPSSLHIRQSTDGTLSAWLDRAISPNDQRNGEFLRVYSADASKLLLERLGDIGPSSHYSGILSEDGQVLTGRWTQAGGGELNAPDRFRKMPDLSGIGN